MMSPDLSGYGHTVVLPPSNGGTMIEAPCQKLLHRLLHHNLLLAEDYDAPRCRRLYKPALPHPAAVQILTQNSPGQFDPDVLEVFKQVAGRFEAIFNEVPE
jgi:hypothetical protein